MSTDLPRTAPTTASLDAAPAASSLAELTDRLVDDQGDLVHAVVRHDDGFRTAPALVPAHLDLLVGFRAPLSWSGVAVVARGATTHVVDDRGHPEPRQAPAWAGESLVVAVAVTRDGDVAATSAGPRHRWTAQGTPEVGGFVVDLCRRVLGLACAAERRTPAELALVQWLSLLLDLAADPATAELVERWPDVAALHPAWDGVDDDPVVLGRAARRLAARWTWESLRQGAASGELHIEGVTPEVASWMDGPFLARWLLGGHRPHTELLDDLRLFLRAEVHLGVARVVEATGVVG